MSAFVDSEELNLRDMLMSEQWMQDTTLFEMLVNCVCDVRTEWQRVAHSSFLEHSALAFVHCVMVSIHDQGTLGQNTDCKC
jgi:hypothetical protein